MTLDEAIKHAEDEAKQAEEHARYIKYMGRYGWEKEYNEYRSLSKSHLQIAKWLEELESYRKMYREQHQDDYLR